MITVKQLSSLSNITNRINQLLKESNQENLIENIVNSIDQFDETQENLDELIYLSKQELLRIEPLIKQMTIATNHLNNIDIYRYILYTSKLISYICDLFACL